MKDRKVSTTAMLRTAVQNGISVIVVLVVSLIALSESGALDELAPYIPPQAYAVITGLIAFSIALSGAITKLMYLPEFEEFARKNLPMLSYLDKQRDEEEEESKISGDETHQNNE